MSVGCYDLLNSRWLVGPDLKDEGFDPYEEYYKSDMRNVKDLIDDIRATILLTYEIINILVKLPSLSLTSICSLFIIIIYECH